MHNQHQIEANIAHWRKLMTSPGLDNEEMAELGIRQLYKQLGKSQLEAIVWCDSPYQLAVIPGMVTNILMGPPWELLMYELRDAGHNEDAWKAAWNKGWRRLCSGQLEFLAQRILEHSDMRPVSDEVKGNALRRLELVMRKIAREDRVRIQSIKARKPANDLGLYSAPVDINFYAAGMRLGALVEQATELVLTFNMYTWLAPFVGAFDVNSMIRLLPPKAKSRLIKPVIPESLRKQLEEVHDLCGDFQRFGFDMIPWFQNTVSLPRRNEQTVFDPTNNNERIIDVVYRATSEAFRNEGRRRADFKVNPNVTHLFALWMPYFAAFLPFATSAMFIDAKVLKKLHTQIETWSYLAHAAFAYNFANNICYVCRKPNFLLASEVRRPHRENGPVAKWDDGFEIYSWKGIVIEREAIMEPGYITVDMIHEARNAEMRRSYIEIYGESRYLMDANAEVVHEDECGTLYQLNLPGDEPLVMVRVRNSTAEPDGTYKHYFLRVPPTIRRAKEAVAWTFNLTESEYQPEHQT